MPVRSGVLGRAATPDGGAYVLFTVPAGETYIIKNIRAFNPTAGSVNVTIEVRNGAATVYVLLAPQSLAASGELDSGIIWLALAPGDQLVYQFSAGGPMIWASGAILPGVAQ